MKKPEKRKEPPTHDPKYDYNRAYNQACDDWEKFLPSEEEIKTIIDKNIHKGGNTKLKLAKILSKRIRGKKE